MALGIGDIIDDKYEIIGVLGEGGMGTVFDGIHRKIHRRVAIKVLKSSVAADESMVRRFEHEAQAAGRIGSKHIVEVLDVGQIADGERYMILEHLEGETLSARVKRVRTMDPREIFPLAIQLLKGVGAAHAAEIVHRDLKPANIFLITVEDDPNDFVKVLDFGVSKFHFLEAEGVTTTGTIVGTPHYMAPEQTKEAGAVDHRADVYAIGAILYRALSGHTPFRVQTIHQLIAKLITEDPPQLATVVTGIDPAAAAIVHQALARNPDDRFQSANQFIEALRAWLEDAGVSFVSSRLSNAGLPSPSASGPGPTAGWTPITSDLGPQAASEPLTTPMLTPQPSWPGEPPAPYPVPPAPSTPAGQPSEAGEPSSLATPSPAFYESTKPSRARRSMVGIVLAGGATVLAGAIVAIASLGGGETAASAETATRAVAAPGGEATVSKAIADEPQPTASASASVSASASASASASSGKAKRPAAKPRSTGRPPKPTARPHPPPRPKPDDRDFRTDL